MRKLADQATYLYVDGSRYWYATQPSVNRLAEELAERYHPEDVTEEIRRRLAEEPNHKGDFAKVHACPAGPSDVVDDPEAKLVILSPDYPHSAKTDSSAGRQAAAEILNRGAAGRNCGNMLVFLAADKTRFVDLDKAVRSYLAWQSIEKQTVSLNLTPFQANQVEQRLTSSDQAVKGRIPETYVWLLVAGPGRGLPQMIAPEVLHIVFPSARWQEHYPLRFRCSQELHQPGRDNILGISPCGDYFFRRGGKDSRNFGKCVQPSRTQESPSCPIWPSVSGTPCGHDGLNPILARSERSWVSPEFGHP